MAWPAETMLMHLSQALYGSVSTPPRRAEPGKQHDWQSDARRLIPGGKVHNRSNPHAVLITTDTHAYKIFENKSGEEYIAEKEAYVALSNNEHTFDIVPQNIEFKTFGDFGIIKLPKLEKVFYPKDGENEKRRRLEKALKEVLEKLWDNGYAHGDIICDGSDDARYVRLSNFMRVPDTDRYVLIDVGNLNKIQENITYERTQWETARFQSSGCIVKQI